MRWRAAGNPSASAQTYLLKIFALNLVDARDIQGEIVLCGLRVRTGGSAAIVSVLIPSLTKPADTGRHQV